MGDGAVQQVLLHQQAGIITSQASAAPPPAGLHAFMLQQLLSNHQCVGTIRGNSQLVYAFEHL